MADVVSNTSVLGHPFIHMEGHLLMDCYFRYPIIHMECSPEVSGIFEEN